MSKGDVVCSKAYDAYMWKRPNEIHYSMFFFFFKDSLGSSGKRILEYSDLSVHQSLGAEDPGTEAPATFLGKQPEHPVNSWTQQLALQPGGSSWGLLAADPPQHDPQFLTPK